MRRRSNLHLLALCWLLLPSALLAGDVRAASWGESMEAVKSGETAPFHHQGQDELAFTDASIEGIDGGIIYLFENGGLVRAVYVSRDEYAGGEGVLDDYEAMRRHFAAQFGTEGEERKRWIGEDGETPTADLAAALAAGRVRVSTSWTLERTQIDLVMSEREGGVFLRAMYQPRS